MCPREKLTRPLSVMGMGLFEKIIGDIRPHAKKIKRLHLHNYGEPLMDPWLAQKISLAKSSGFDCVYLVTNGSLLTDDMSRKLIASGLDEFKVSFYGTDPATYQATMQGLDFEKTMRNLESFFRIREELKSATPRIIIQYLPHADNRQKTEDFVALFNNKIDAGRGDQLSIFALHNYGSGKRFHVFQGKPVSVCNYPWSVMLIWCDGRVGLCCMDFDAQCVVGDVSTRHVLSVWNGDAMKTVRRDFKRLKYGQYPACINCDQIH